MHDVCPVCGKPAEARFSCKKRDAFCGYGHNWHFCLIHGTLVLGQADHESVRCSCWRHREERSNSFEKYISGGAMLAITVFGIGVSYWTYTTPHLQPTIAAKPPHQGPSIPYQSDRESSPLDTRS